MKPCLPETVKSIYDNIPVNRLIVVDGGSRDGTIEFLSTLPNVEFIDDRHGNRATAREKGIKAVETDWHLHVDSDVILCRDWYRYAKRLIKDDVGAIWGVALPIERHMFNNVYSMSRLYHMKVSDTLIRQVFSRRFMTHDTLFRTDLVRDMKIPRDLFVWEDHYLGMQVVNKGFKFVKTKIPYCLHMHSERSLKDFFFNGYTERKYGFYSSKDVLVRSVLAFPKGIWIMMVTGDYIASKLQILNYVYMLKGWLYYRGGPANHGWL